jgi:drug/metabolite transporter (DMT)-like permease
MVIIYLGAAQIALAYVLVTTGLKQVTALEASLLLLLEPVLSPVWAWIVHGERPAAMALVGGCVILLASAARTLAAQRR